MHGDVSRHKKIKNHNYPVLFALLTIHPFFHKEGEYPEIVVQKNIAYALGYSPSFLASAKKKGGTAQRWGSSKILLHTQKIFFYNNIRNHQGVDFGRALQKPSYPGDI